MSVVEVISQADEWGLAVSGLACLDRCVPLLGGGDEVLRPLWTALADTGRSWDDGMAAARTALAGTAAGPHAGLADAAALTRQMLDAAPDGLRHDLTASADASVGGPVYAWADACSATSLEIHHLLAAAGDVTWSVTRARAGEDDGTIPLVAAELRRQKQILGLLSEEGSGGLRRALDLTTEGRRVVRAVVSRRARAGA
jgi:hypothetical protein